jgi:hypothetical protein
MAARASSRSGPAGPTVTRLGYTRQRRSPSQADAVGLPFPTSRSMSIRYLPSAPNRTSDALCVPLTRSPIARAATLTPVHPWREAADASSPVIALKSVQ